MNSNFLICCTAGFFLTVVLSGCGLDVMTATAVHGELQAQSAKAALGQMEQTKRTMGNISFNQAVQAYRAEHGANPPSLEALVPNYLPAVPRMPDGTPCQYDPATGTLTEASAAMGPVTPADLEMIRNIKSAINQYGTATGFYPPTLDALHPDYLPQAPRTSSGEEFLYNNQNGDVRHPHQAAPGISPVQTAAPVAMPSHVRGRINDIAGQQTDRQNQAMDKLGL